MYVLPSPQSVSGIRSLGAWDACMLLRRYIMIIYCTTGGALCWSPLLLVRVRRRGARSPRRRRQPMIGGAEKSPLLFYGAGAWRALPRALLPLLCRSAAPSTAYKKKQTGFLLQFSLSAKLPPAKAKMGENGGLRFFFGAGSSPSET